MHTGLCIYFLTKRVVKIGVERECEEGASTLNWNVSMASVHGRQTNFVITNFIIMSCYCIRHYVTRSLGFCVILIL